MAKPCAARKILDGSALYTIPARVKEREIVLERDATIIGRFRKQYVAWVPITSLSTKKVLVIFTHFSFMRARLFSGLNATLSIYVNVLIHVFRRLPI